LFWGIISTIFISIIYGFFLILTLYLLVLTFSAIGLGSHLLSSSNVSIGNDRLINLLILKERWPRRSVGTRWPQKLSTSA